MRYSNYIILTAVIIITISIANDYSITIDEPTRRSFGIQYLKLSFEKFGFNLDLLKDVKGSNNSEQRFIDMYGMVFEFPALALEFLFSPDSKKTIYLIRHILNHIFFLSAIVMLFQIFKNLFEDKILSYLACIFVYLNPVIFGSSFFNCKDIIFLFSISFFLFCFQKYQKKLSYLTLILLAMSIGICTSTRNVGIYLLPTSLFFSFLIMLERNRMLDFAFLLAFLKNLVFLSTFSFLFTFMLIPEVWFLDFMDFINSYKSSAKHWHEGPVLYRGEFYHTKNLPIHYPLYRFFVETPITFLLLLFLGFNNYVYKIFLKVKQDTIFHLAFVSILIPVSLVIILKPILYDGWRHFFFIYTFLVFFIVMGFKFIVDTFDDKYKKSITFFLAIICFLEPLISVIKYHPYQYLYKNNLISSNPIRSNGSEIQGMSYYDGFKWIAKNDSSKLKVWVRKTEAKYNLQLLPKKLRDKIEIIGYDNKQPLFNYGGSDKIDYYLTNYYNQFPHIEKYIASSIGYEFDEVFSKYVAGEKIFSVFKLEKSIH